MRTTTCIVFLIDVVLSYFVATFDARCELERGYEKSAQLNKQLQDVRQHEVDVTLSRLL